METDTNVVHLGQVKGAKTSIIGEGGKYQQSNGKENYKDKLLEALYTQVEFLKHELDEKNFLIRTLVVREGECLSDGDLSSTPAEEGNGKTSKDVNNKRTKLKGVSFNENKEANTHSNETPNLPWRPNTILIAGDSILSSVDPKRISQRHDVKLRVFPGSTISDMYSYLEPLLKKKPSHVYLHVGCKDAKHKSSEEILAELVKLKGHIEGKLPKGVVVISYPTSRSKDRKAGLTVRRLSDKDLFTKTREN